ncbi:hypothetical protein HBI56_053840 [Parastagonospora nodorum]|uniref:Uncharacterized protein n=1 Tax=Phaeosphaeria nodorum (strain SN15 / ATCC MYA-4574 / FGSC 10173) TaxID=321614 RepID=A0A7U2ICH6_PHANO|nr:hypothetical protein HBH56_098240 [Parastagonospora nodorum]QRD07362.1 hypothetical protein JI435_132430 [Parastagonospora nodorum SN15]KAH3930130.1 hypothetical protein HBH54_112560 [Parastagonospora nodorum]KAH3938982.1 hypothetical protein HBH53_242110 [Parastagonospora nodorum]KAH3964696.1 hypothetical protein HBH51_159460 [Parastagonospora nodorum]
MLRHQDLLRLLGVYGYVQDALTIFVLSRFAHGKFALLKFCSLLFLICISTVLLTPQEVRS